ncbi:Eco57I restriction-modification methylase domain-containing protein [Proteocatella sphenisci]|uniref:Eco57I restriction-modification methylase domain-containing protein n=1 Tax=Proteocatella sphenisci TaxID=181070 RepID=UPI00048BE749|nr:TaqI-like C-terminal specificity domain-containing protein [Proteocatella sphenisci]
MDARKQFFKDTLEKSFEISQFTKFTTEFFNNLEIVRPDKFVNDSRKWSEFSYHIEGYHHIANFSGEDRAKIAVFAVELKSHKTVENARSMQRNFVKKLMDAAGVDGAIAAFYTKGEGKWRLSFIRLDYEFAKGKITEKLTPAKRYSYLVGELEPCHTAEERLYPIFMDDQGNPTLDQIEEAFSVEKVTKEFFENYRKKYIGLKEHLESNEDFMHEAERLDFTSEQFSKKLMGQLAFLYFIQKKGWLGVNAFPETLTQKQYNDALYFKGKITKEIIPAVYGQTGEDQYTRISGKTIEEYEVSKQEILAAALKGQSWGTGPRDFLRKMYDNCQKKNLNFFDDYLEPLFYEALNEQRGDIGYYNKLKCKVPFLNGGLFEPLDNYDWNHNDFDIPNEMFSNIDLKGKEDADGILDIFDRYNFTMNEDEPLEKEVAVDPEMLGKIFENLLDVKDRKSKGAFYTPREIVHYMCQESLANHISNETGISYDAIKDFIVYGEFMKDQDTNISSRNGDSELFISTEILDTKSNINRLKDVDDALANIRVADPAVGSGAFPLGMLSEIVRARKNITEYMVMIINDKFKSRMLYEIDRHPLNLKYHTIKNSIFAVDIDPSAVDITKLRLWLSLVVDQETDENAVDDGMHAVTRNPRPLPNLDCNIRCGNSLIDELDGAKLINESDLFGNRVYQISVGQNQYDSLLSRLFEAQDRLFYEKNHSEKEQIKRSIRSIIDNIVLLNLGEGINPAIVEKYNEVKNQPSPPFFLWQLEFARVFKEKGGFDVVIGNPPYGAKFSKNEKNILSKLYRFVPDYESSNFFIDKSKELLKFDGLVNYIIPNMFMANINAKKYREQLIQNWEILVIDDLSNIDVFDSAKVRTCIILLKNNDKEFFAKFNKMTIKLNQIKFLKSKCTTKNDLSNFIDNWLNIIDKSNDQIIICKKITNNSIPFSDISDISQGLIPYDKYRGHSIETIKNRVWHSDFKKDETYRPELAGKDVNRFSIKWNGKIWISYGDWLAAPRKKEYFNSERILIREITNPRILAAFTSEEFYNTPSIINCINIKCNIKYILGILNSKLMTYYHMSSSPKANKGLFPKILVNDVRRLPIKYADEIDHIEMVKLVDEYIKALEVSSDDEISEIDKRIDELVYKIYDINDSEVKVIEETVKC